VEELRFHIHFSTFYHKIISKVFPIEAKVVNGKNHTPKEFVIGNVKRCGPSYTEISFKKLSANTLPLVQGSRVGIHATCNTSVVSDPHIY
jgi:hypothetical protein